MKIIKKFILGFLLILLLLVLVFFLIQKGLKPLDSNRVSLVDKIENNYIFRGNNPLITKNDKVVFAYDELKSDFNEILEKQGHQPLNDYYLIDISLLDFDQYFLIKKEEEFFTKHPNYGKMTNISTLSPSLVLNQFLPENILTNHYIKKYNLWLDSRIKEIRNLALQKMDKPIVVYIHCDSGRDRTGLIVTSYRLLFNNIGLSQTRPLDLKEVGRSSMVSYDHAIRSYCRYVKQTYGKPDDYCSYPNVPKN